MKFSSNTPALAPRETGQGREGWHLRAVWGGALEDPFPKSEFCELALCLELCDLEAANFPSLGLSHPSTKSGVAGQKGYGKPISVYSSMVPKTQPCRGQPTGLSVDTSPHHHNHIFFFLPQCLPLTWLYPSYTCFGISTIQIYVHKQYCMVLCVLKFYKVISSYTHSFVTCVFHLILFLRFFSILIYVYVDLFIFDCCVVFHYMNKQKLFFPFFVLQNEQCYNWYSCICFFVQEFFYGWYLYELTYASWHMWPWVQIYLETSIT